MFKKNIRVGVVLATVVATMGLGLIAGQAATASATVQRPAAACAGNPEGFSDPTATIGVSYSFLGNSWRATMEKDMTTAMNNTIACKEIGHVDYVYAGTSTTQQISQIDDLILKHVSAILYDAQSSTGLNSVIAKAVAAGIPCFAFDTPVTSTKAYVLEWNFYNIGLELADYLVKEMDYSGNAIIVRGVAGSPIDIDQYNAWEHVIKMYPKIHILATVWSNWDDATGEAAVAGILPTLPAIKAIFSSGSEYGEIEAFTAAHRPIPFLVCREPRELPPVVVGAPNDLPHVCVRRFPTVRSFGPLCCAVRAEG